MNHSDSRSENPEDAAEEGVMEKPEFAIVLRQRREALLALLNPILAAGRPLVWEVGCGHGHFLTAYAEAHREHTCLGIDIAGDRIGRALRKRDRAGLAHLHFLRAEAGLFLDTLPAEVRFQRVFALFPDPWPKLRHHKHRLIQPAFLDRLADRLGEEGRFYFRTDYAPYFTEAVELIRGHPRWELVGEPWPFEYGTVFQERAEQFDSLVARRRGTASAG